MAMLRTLLILACIVACCSAYIMGYRRYAYTDDDYYPYGYGQRHYRGFFPRRFGYYGYPDKK